jgi:VIT1/CCC1 family predicted Fe2+/Mn2+ transporter
MQILEKTIHACTCGKDKKNKRYSVAQLITGTLLLGVLVGVTAYFYTSYFAAGLTALILLMAVLMALYYALKGHAAPCALRRASIKTLANASDFMSFS